MTDQQPAEIVDAPRLLEAYAKSLAVYYAAEKAFMAAPTTQTVYDYHVAVDRLRALRVRVVESATFAGALLGTEQDESVGR